MCSPACGLKALVEAHGSPGFYSDDAKDGSSLCHFQSLAKAIVYQQLAGKAAATIWNRLLSLVADGQGKPNKPNADVDRYTHTHTHTHTHTNTQTKKHTNTHTHTHTHTHTQESGQARNR